MSISDMSNLFQELIYNPPSEDISVYNNGQVSETFFNEVVEPRLRNYINNKKLLNFHSFVSLDNILDKNDLENTVPVKKFGENFKINFQGLNRLSIGLIIFNYYLYLINSIHVTPPSFMS